MHPTTVVSESAVSFEDLVACLRLHAEALPPAEDASAFGAAFDRFADARVVLLGEATHGTSEFYRARAAITRRLVEQHGFRVIAVEADWPDATRIDQYVRHRDPEPTRERAFTRFPTWMWRNAEVSEFMEWLRTYNEARPSADRVEFRGLDIYGLRGSIAAVLDYLDRVDPAEAAAARHRYGCLTPWQHEPQEYGRAMLHHERPACEDAVVQQVKALLDRRLGVIAQDGEAWFDATQNARAVRAAEHYYRAMFLGAAESWNLRDRHMFDTLRSLLQARGPEAKAVVWAHNSHIGNAAATEMGWQGEFNIGELCRTAYADDAVLIGFGTDRGTVAAASNWNAPMAIREVRPSLPDSYERAFRDVGQPRSLTDWRRPDRARLRACLSSPRLERAIGVIYRADRERQSHYFQAVLSEQFDAFVWFEDTTAVTPLGEEHAKQLPDTFPFAL